jgi:hypothetical protein
MERKVSALSLVMMLSPHEPPFAVEEPAGALLDLHDLVGPLIDTLAAYLPLSNPNVEAFYLPDALIRIVAEQ